MIVVWLVDHRATPNGFTRLVQWFSACQGLMDPGLFIYGSISVGGYYKYITYSASINPFLIWLLKLAVSTLTCGDVSSVMFTTVMAYTFYRIARTEGAIDITRYLKWGVGIRVISGVAVAIAQRAFCVAPD